MAKKKTIKKTPVILRNALSVYERSITRFSDVVCQFTVQNGNQISYDILEVSANPDPTPRVERSITRFKEVVCEFVVIDGTDVHAYELEPVYVDLTGGGTTYTITNNLTNVTNSNAAASVGDGDPYNATLTADAGYTLDSVTVTMGGNDVTASVYDSGVISIPAVTGNIVITASAASVPTYEIIEVDEAQTTSLASTTYLLSKLQDPTVGKSFVLLSTTSGNVGATQLIASIVKPDLSKYKQLRWTGSGIEKGNIGGVNGHIYVGDKYLAIPSSVDSNIEVPLNTGFDVSTVTVTNAIIQASEINSYIPSSAYICIPEKFDDVEYEFYMGSKTGGTKFRYSGGSIQETSSDSYSVVVDANEKLFLIHYV